MKVAGGLRQSVIADAVPLAICWCRRQSVTCGVAGCCCRLCNGAGGAWWCCAAATHSWPCEAVPAWSVPDVTWGIQDTEVVDPRVEVIIPCVEPASILGLTQCLAVELLQDVDVLIKQVALHLCALASGAAATWQWTADRVGEGFGCIWISKQKACALEGDRVLCVPGEWCALSMVDTHSLAVLWGGGDDEPSVDAILAIPGGVVLEADGGHQLHLLLLLLPAMGQWEEEEQEGGEQEDHGDFLKAEQDSIRLLETLYKIVWPISLSAVQNKNPQIKSSIDLLVRLSKLSSTLWLFTFTLSLLLFSSSFFT